jgi:toxic protein SymE
METQLKRIKLHSKHRSRVRQPGRNVPWLNINGLWLEHAGFPIGQTVEIAIEPRRLTISAL